MGELQALELGKGREEALGESGEALVPLVVLLVDPAPVVVDRVIAAPEDAAVGRRAVVVEPVRRIGEPLTVLPADRVPLGGR